MIGKVSSDLEAVLPLQLRGPTGRCMSVDALMDTGFSDYLTLPPADVHALQLAYRETVLGTLADGTVVSLDVHRAEVLWDGRWRGILVCTAEGGTLFGMALLRDHRVGLDVVDGGSLVITRLP